MKPKYADMLAAKYIKGMEQDSHIVSIMELFDTKKDGFKAMGALGETDLKNVHLNYTTLSDYTRSLNLNRAQQLHSNRLGLNNWTQPTRMAPIRP